MVISLAETPNTKVRPPLCPLLRLCLMIENKTGPTEILSNKPNPNPFKIASNINKQYIKVKNLFQNRERGLSNEYFKSSRFPGTCSIRPAFCLSSPGEIYSGCPVFP